MDVRLMDYGCITLALVDQDVFFIPGLPTFCYSTSLITYAFYSHTTYPL